MTIIREDIQLMAKVERLMDKYQAGRKEAFQISRTIVRHEMTEYCHEPEVQKCLNKILEALKEVEQFAEEQHENEWKKGGKRGEEGSEKSTPKG